MTKQIRLDWHALWISVLTAAAFGLFIGAGADTVAQEQGCEVGTRVEFEDGTRGVGTIEEIGTESPHVGWYRVSFSWSPKGEWYPPTFGIFIAGTKIKCGQAPGRGRLETRNGRNASRPAPETAVGTPASDGCPFTEPQGRVTKSSPASTQLFKRVIFDTAAARIDPDSITAPKKVGLTFLEFNLGEPYKNTLTSSRFGDKRRHDGAPVGAMIYPIKTRELRCDLHGGEVRRWVAEVNRDCFKNRDGEWTCPGRTTKVVENRLILLK